MSNILKSTKLDIALVKPYFKTICFTLLLPIVFAAINRSLLTGVSFAMCFIAMTTGYTFSITEKNSMDRLFGILPVRKSELVIGRYVFVLAMGLLSLIISLIAQPLDMIILKSFIFYSDEIKKDEKLINAYEDILLALTEIRNEKAAVLLDEFRIH